MSREERVSIRRILWEDLLLTAVFSWIIKKLLDFLWEKVRIRLRFEGNLNLEGYLWKFFGEFMAASFISTLAGMLKDTKAWQKEDIRRMGFRSELKSYLGYHRRYHSRFESKQCRCCSVIIQNRKHLEALVSDPKLYPPFKFRK